MQHAIKLRNSPMRNVLKSCYNYQRIFIVKKNIRQFKCTGNDIIYNLQALNESMLTHWSPILNGSISVFKYKTNFNCNQNNNKL